MRHRSCRGKSRTSPRRGTEGSGYSAGRVCGNDLRASLGCCRLQSRVKRAFDVGKGVESALSYRVATIDELQDIAYRQDTHMRPVRHHLGITAFGTNAWTAANEGDRLMPEHEEDEGSEELYVVLRGRAHTRVRPAAGKSDRLCRGAGDDGACDRQHRWAGV